jgi:hypothetical protein
MSGNEIGELSCLQKKKRIKQRSWQIKNKGSTIIPNEQSQLIEAVTEDGTHYLKLK